MEQNTNSKAGSFVLADLLKNAVVSGVKGGQAGWEGGLEHRRYWLLTNSKTQGNRKLRQPTKTMWHKQHTHRLHDLPVSRKRSLVLTLTVAISRLVSGVQAGRSDEQVCGRCVAARATHTPTHTHTREGKSQDNTGKYRLLWPEQQNLLLPLHSTLLPRSLIFLSGDVSGTLRSA